MGDDPNHGAACHNGAVLKTNELGIRVHGAAQDYAVAPFLVELSAEALGHEPEDALSELTSLVLGLSAAQTAIRCARVRAKLIVV